MMRTTVRRLSGHDSGVPSGLRVQSKARIKVAISPEPGKMASRMPGWGELMRSFRLLGPIGAPQHMQVARPVIVASRRQELLSWFKDGPPSGRRGHHEAVRRNFRLIRAPSLLRLPKLSLPDEPSDGRGEARAPSRAAPGAPHPPPDVRPAVRCRTDRSQTVPRPAVVPRQAPVQWCRCRPGARRRRRGGTLE